jgi:hypothetical protein
LVQLAELHRQQVLSDDEYEAAVARVVGDPTSQEEEDPSESAIAEPSFPEPDYDISADVPDRQAKTGLPRGALVVVGVVAIALIIGLVIASTRGDSERAALTGPTGQLTGGSTGQLPTVDPELAALQSAADQFNKPSNYIKNAFANIGSLGTNRCGMGFSADFPDLVLVTMATSSGMWMQVSVSPASGVELQSLRSGEDYASAGIDESFWAQAYPCAIGSDGTVTLL